MSERSSPLVSIVLPLFNEQAGLLKFHTRLMEQLADLKDFRFEVIYCDDGSRDGSNQALHQIAAKDKRVRVIALSRNFGKEIASAAGIEHARGEAIITLDSDGQHPVELLPEFLRHWRSGAKVVVGVRTAYAKGRWLKKTTSKLFYRFLNRVTGLGLEPGVTDYCLIDQTVQADFVRLTERNRITRGLIDWLGYQRTYISFTAAPRLHDTAAYSFKKLCKLAIDSVVSLSTSPLYIMAYIGAIVLPVAFVLGVVMVADKLMGDPFGWHLTGSAFVSVLLLFLMGVVLMSQGIIGLYLSHIHSEAQNRPLYVINREASRRL